MERVNQPENTQFVRAITRKLMQPTDWTNISTDKDGTVTQATITYEQPRDAQHVTDYTLVMRQVKNGELSASKTILSFSTTMSAGYFNEYREGLFLPPFNNILGLNPSDTMLPSVLEALQDIDNFLLTPLLESDVKTKAPDSF